MVASDNCVKFKILKQLIKNNAQAQNNIVRYPQHESVIWRQMPPLLIEYQKQWVIDDSPIKICEKSRRIGLSWADAAISVMDAYPRKGCNTFYVGYNREMAEQYIEDCAYWAESFNVYAQKMDKDEFIDESGKSIMVYRIRFKSGHHITALSSKPANLRAKKGKIVIDEAAFHDRLSELIKAGLAIMMWGRKFGGQVRIISTHNGIDNHFNEIIKDTLAGKLDYSHHKYDLDRALDDGLYKRISLVNEEVWTQQAQTKWRAKLIKDYGINADEELFCIPKDIKGGGKVFNKAWFRYVDEAPHKMYPLRFYDYASTSEEVKKDAYFTASVLMAVDRRVVHGEPVSDYYIYDAQAEQLAPAESDERMLAQAKTDGYIVKVRGELEGGSAGLRVEEHLKSLLSGFDYESIKPQGDKVTRATPIASAAKRGNVFIVRRSEYNRNGWDYDRFINAIHGFDGSPKPLTNDFADALSGAQSCLELTKLSGVITGCY